MLFIIAFFVVFMIVIPQIKYQLKLYTYFKMHEAHNQRAQTRINRKPRKPARPTI